MTATTPWNPSPAATARVKDPLPTPTRCNCCGSTEVALVNNSAIYHGKSFGEWPWAYLCMSCRAYVGLHPQTGIPLGTLADEETRKWRRAAKDLFQPMWQGRGSLFKSRSAAYQWLGEQLRVSAAECHFGMFSVERCKQAIAVIKTYRGLE